MLIFTFFSVKYQYNLGLLWEVKVVCRDRYILPDQEAFPRCISGGAPNIVEEPLELLVNGQVLLPTHVDHEFLPEYVHFNLH